MKPILKYKVIILSAVAAALAPLLFVTAFVVPSHKPRPHDLPIAVAGPTAAASPSLRSLGSVKVIKVSGPVAARHAVRDRDAYGAIITGRRPSVDIASGGSFVVATLLKQQALQAGIAPSDIHDVAPLPSGDPRGTNLNLVMLALLITSILSGSLMTMRLPALARGRRELILTGVSIVVGAGTAGLLKALSALPGPFAAESALLAGLVLAVSLTAAGLVRLRGTAGTSLAFALFLVVANPASGLATGRNLLPTPWRQYGPLMPPGAAGQAIRGSAFFGGAADLGPILVLLAWVAVGLALNELGRRRAPTVSSAPDAPPALNRNQHRDAVRRGALPPRRLSTPSLRRRPEETPK